MKYLLLATLLVLTATAFVADYMPEPQEIQPAAEVILKTLDI